MDKYTGEGIMALRDFVVSRGTGGSGETPIPQLVAKAKQAADAFRKGRDSDDIAATFGLTDSGKIDRGDLFDFAVKIKLSPALYAAATKLDARQPSEPIEEDGNVHVLLMEKRQRSTVHTLEDARDAVLADFKREAQTRVENANLSYLKSKADIQVTPEYRQ
jgi:parvulin-like peptidyl-prolyl isomerase